MRIFEGRSAGPHGPRRIAAFSRCLPAFALLVGSHPFCHPALGADTDTQAAQLIGRFGLRESSMAARDLPGWRKPVRILVMADTRERMAWLQSAAPGVEFLMPTASADAAALIGNVDAAIGLCDRKLIEAGKSLRWVQSSSAGVERCRDAPSLQAGRVLLTNAQRVTGPSVAEHAIALVFALSRGTAAYVRNQAQGNFAWDTVPADGLVELEGRTMLVVGLGGIGTEIDRRAHGLGMKVIATSASSQHRPDFVAHVGKPQELPALLQQADVIVSVVPLTPQTTGMFNADLFARMKRSALFVNVGRGASVVQADLLAALRNKQIAGAGLDVTTPEPLPKDDPLWQAPNLIITPHVAGLSDLNRERVWVLMRENLRRYVAGEKMLSVVDVRRGY